MPRSYTFGVSKLPPRLIVALPGATGAIYGVRLLEMLRGAAVETHLVISPWGRRTLLHETSYTVDQAPSLAGVTCASQRPGSGDFQRLLSDAGNGGGAVRHAHAGAIACMALATISCTGPRMWC